MGIALVAVQPQGVTDDGERLMSVLFLLRKNAAQDGTNAEGWKYACAKTGGVDFLRNCASGKLIAGADVSAKRRKCAGRVRVCADFASRHGGIRAASQMISQQNQTLGIG